MAEKVLQPAPAVPLRTARLLLVALLVLALAGAVALAGSRLIKPAPVIPQGGAAVLAFYTFPDGTSSQTGDIFTVRADGTDKRQLTGGPGIRSWPVWSPDGTRITYHEWQAGTDSVVVTDATGANRTTVYATPSASFCTSFGYEARGRMAWSPDGTSLVFPTSRGCHEAPFELFVARADGSSAATGLVTPTAGIESAFPAWSPDGKQIAFLGSETGGSTGVYVADVGPSGALPGGLQARHIGSDTAGTLGFALSGPQWSPDGTLLAVTNGIFDDTTKTSGIVVMKPDGSGQRVIAQDAGQPLWSPIWSPSGRELAYFRAVDPTEYFNGRPCTVRAWVIDADGTDERRLDPLAEGCDMAPAWSPDGTRLSVLLIKPDDPNPWRMSVMMLDGSESLVTLGDGAVGSWQPVAAPLLPAPSFGATEPSP